MGICDIPAISTVCTTAGEAAASMVSAPFDWLAHAMGEAAAWLIKAMWSVFDTTTLVSLAEPGILRVYSLVFGIAVFLVVIFFCLQLITGLLRRDPTALTRAALGAARSVLGSFLVITLIALALEIVDHLSTGIVQAAGETTKTMGDKIALLAAGLSAISVAGPGVGAIVTIFLAGLMIAAIAILWFSLLIRKALILVAVVLAPIAFSGSSWDTTRSWIGKWAAFVLALIVSKLVLVVIFLIAITQIATPIDADLKAVTEPITGIVLLGIAAFAPYIVYKFIAFLGFDLYHATGTEQEAKQALNRPIPLPTKPPTNSKNILGTGNNGSNGGGGGSGQPAPTPPTPSTGMPGGTEGAAAGSAAGPGAGAGASAAAGPAGVALLGTQALKAAATAGPKAGQALGNHADSTAGAAGQPGGTTPAVPPSTGAPTPTTSTAPSLPPARAATTTSSNGPKP